MLHVQPLGIPLRARGKITQGVGDIKRFARVSQQVVVRPLHGYPAGHRGSGSGDEQLGPEAAGVPGDTFNGQTRWRFRRRRESAGEPPEERRDLVLVEHATDCHAEHQRDEGDGDERTEEAVPHVPTVDAGWAAHKTLRNPASSGCNPPGAGTAICRRLGAGFPGGGPFAVLLSPVALTIGIVGLPNAGKSTLFNALTKNNVLAANYPFATIEPNIGVVGVPDARLGVLAKLFESAKTLPATVQFVDIAGIVRGASEGEGLGNKFLSHIRESDAICQVTRVFEDDDVTHVEGKVNPADDISTIQTELILADLQTVEKALPRLEKEARLKKENAVLLEAVREVKSALEAGTPILATSIDKTLVRELMLMTAKPFIYVFNCDADELGDEELKARMREIVAPSEAIFLDAKFEAELVELGDDDEARAMLEEMGVDEPGLDVLARVGFDTLGLQTYLTAGPKESRAWTIKQGATAPEAAGVIHTDFQRGFIKAEIVSYDDLVAAGSMNAAKAAGKVRIEGKDYVMADGDVVEFRFGSTSTSRKP